MGILATMEFSVLFWAFKGILDVLNFGNFVISNSILVGKLQSTSLKFGIFWILHLEV